MTKPKAEADKFIVRMPDGMRDRIARLAKDQGRSMNAQVVAMLEKGLEDGDALGELWDMVETLQREVSELQVSVFPNLYDPDGWK